MTRYVDIWNFGQHNKVWPLGFLFMTPPNEQQGEYADKALVTIPMLYDEVAKWEETEVGSVAQITKHGRRRKLVTCWHSLKSCIQDSVPVLIRSI